MLCVIVDGELYHDYLIFTYVYIALIYHIIEKFWFVDQHLSTLR